MILDSVNIFWVYFHDVLDLLRYLWVCSFPIFPCIDVFSAKASVRLDIYVPSVSIFMAHLPFHGLCHYVKILQIFVLHAFLLCAPIVNNR